MVRGLPGVVSEAYPPRTVHSLYFDTPELMLYRESLAGVRERRKVRLRWYGPGSGLTLEIKEKTGWASRKRLVRLEDPGEDRGHANLGARVEALARELPELELHGLRPLLFVAYERRYYQAAAQPARLTIDAAVRFAPTLARARPFPPVHSGAILELKSPLELEAWVRGLSGAIPYRLSRNSKYAQGVEAIAGR